MSYADFLHILPLGNLNPPDHTFPTSHMYFALGSVQGPPGSGPFGNGAVFPQKPVFAVADGVIVEIGVTQVTTVLSGQTTRYEEYSFVLGVCGGLRARYGHVGPLSAELQAAVSQAARPNYCNIYDGAGSTYELCNYRPDLPVRGGQQLAMTSGRVAAFDFGAYDFVDPVAGFGRPDLYGDEAKGSICLLSLYSGDEKAKMSDRVGGWGTEKPPAGWCGKVNQDMPGTAQGNWFKDITKFSSEDENVALIYDSIDPSKPVFSLGRSVPGAGSGTLYFSPRPNGEVNRLFADVKPGGGTYCYEGFGDRWGNKIDGYTLRIALADPETLHIEAVPGALCGTGPWVVSASAATLRR